MNIFEDIFDKIDRIVASLSVSPEEKEDFKKQLQLALYANILDKLFSYLREKDLKENPDFEKVKRATIEDIEELDGALMRIFSNLSKEEKAKISEQILFSSGEIIGKVLKPLFNTFSKEELDKAYGILGYNPVVQSAQ